jgi:hypothetical protein
MCKPKDHPTALATMPASNVDSQDTLPEIACKGSDEIILQI